MVSIFFNSPEESLIEIPTLASAVEYLFKSVPSSNVSPSYKPWILENNVLKLLPTTSALSREVAVTVAKAEAAYS
jgi:hypothetical protein